MEIEAAWNEAALSGGNGHLAAPCNNTWNGFHEVAGSGHQFAQNCSGNAAVGQPAPSRSSFGSGNYCSPTAEAPAAAFSQLHGRSSTATSPCQMPQLGYQGEQHALNQPQAMLGLARSSSIPASAAGDADVPSASPEADNAAARAWDWLSVDIPDNAQQRADTPPFRPASRASAPVVPSSTNPAANVFTGAAQEQLPEAAAVAASAAALAAAAATGLNLAGESCPAASSAWKPNPGYAPLQQASASAPGRTTATRRISREGPRPLIQIHAETPLERNPMKMQVLKLKMPRDLRKHWASEQRVMCDHCGSITLQKHMNRHLVSCNGGAGTFRSEIRPRAATAIRAPRTSFLPNPAAGAVTPQAQVQVQTQSQMQQPQAQFQQQDQEPPISTSAWDSHDMSIEAADAGTPQSDFWTSTGSPSEEQSFCEGPGIDMLDAVPLGDGMEDFDLDLSGLCDDNDWADALASLDELAESDDMPDILSNGMPMLPAEQVQQQTCQGPAPAVPAPQPLPAVMPPVMQPQPALPYPTPFTAAPASAASQFPPAHQPGAQPPFPMLPPPMMMPPPLGLLPRPMLPPPSMMPPFPPPPGGLPSLPSHQQMMIQQQAVHFHLMMARHHQQALMWQQTIQAQQQQQQQAQAQQVPQAAAPQQQAQQVQAILPPASVPQQQQA